MHSNERTKKKRHVNTVLKRAKTGDFFSILKGRKALVIKIVILVES